MSWRTVLLPFCIAVLVASGCGSDDSGGDGDATAIAGLPERPAEAVETERVTLAWDTPDGESWPLDLIRPVDDAEGGWPVLVTFHGAATGTSAFEMAEVAKSGWSSSPLDGRPPSGR